VSGVQSDKTSSPVGSLIEGLNKEPSSDSTASAHITSLDTCSSAETNAASQFRSPLLRQMIGNKLSTGSRPVSAAMDVTVSTPGDSVTPMSRDTFQMDQPSAVAMPTSIADEIALCDDPLEPSPRIQASADLPQVPAEPSSLKPLPIEVWTENTTLDLSCQSHDNPDDKDELCVEDEPLAPSPRPKINIDVSNSPGLPTSHLDPASSRSDHKELEDNDEICVPDIPLEPFPRLEVSTCGKLEERTSAFDEDRDIDTTEMKTDLADDTSKWNGVEKAGSSPSALLNGYVEDVNIQM